MKPAIPLLSILVLTACQSFDTLPRQQITRTRVDVGEPQRVFARPVADIVPELREATLARERGRVGNELVFWAYDLPDGQQRWLYACAILPGLDCEERIARVCPVGPQTVLVRREEPGAVRRMNCQLVGQAAPGDLYPNCQDHTDTLPVALGLLSCGQ